MGVIIGHWAIGEMSLRLVETKIDLCSECLEEEESIDHYQCVCAQI